MFTTKLLLVLGSITQSALPQRAAGAVCGQRSPTLLALPGKPGSPGLPGTVPDAVIGQLREDIIVEVIKFICKGNSENSPATSCKEIYI